MFVSARGRTHKRTHGETLLNTTGRTVISTHEKSRAKSHNPSEHTLSCTSSITWQRRRRRRPGHRVPACFFLFLFFYSGSCWIHLSPSFCRLLSISNTTYVCLKMCTRSFGGERRGRGLVLASQAWLGWTTLSSSSAPQPPRSFLKLAERIHRLSGGERRHQLTCRQFHGIIWTIVSWRFVACSFVFFVSHYTHAEIMHVTCTHTDPANMCGCVLWKTNASCFPNPVWLQSNLVILTRRGKYRITVIEESGIYYLWERGLPTVTITMLIQAC